MAVVGRSIKPDQASDINEHGASTDEERANSIAAHIAEMHTGSGNETPNEYYYDDIRDKNLSTQIFYVDFFHADRTRKRYLDFKPNKPSSDVPYKSLAPYDYCVVGYQLHMKTAKSGDIIELRDKTNNFATILTVNIVVSNVEQYNDTEDIVVLSGTELAAYGTDEAPIDPLFRVFLRRIYP